MRWGIVVAAFVLFLISCAPAEEAPPAEPEVTEPEPVTEPEVVEEPEVEEEPETQVIVESAPVEEEIYERPEEEPPSIAKFLEQYRDEVRNYKFTYHSDTWVVEGDYAKVILFRILQNKFHAPFIDTIYLNLDRRTAFGVCEGREKTIKTQCIIQDSLDKKFALPYVQFKIKLPHEWLVDSQNLYVTEAETPQLVMDRNTVHLKHTTQTKTIDFFIDPQVSLPVVVIEDGSEHKYENLAKNQFGREESMNIEQI